MEKGLFLDDEKIFYPKDVVEAIKKVGIKSGDVVFVHTDISKFGRLAEVKERREFNTTFLNACLEATGHNGTLVVPTFTYSFGDEFGAKKFFDVENTPSILNYFTEVARTSNGFQRSDDPMLSVVSKGPLTPHLIDNLSTCCLGKGSVWERLHEKNSHNLMLGFKFDSTFIHYIENYFRVPYRHDIELTGIIKKNKKQFKKTYTYFARDRKIKTKLNREKLYLLALEKKILKKTTLGAGEIMSIKSKDLFSVSGKMLEENPYSLVTIPK